MLFFTVCTIQQLAEAMVLGDSLRTQSPDYKLVIGLVDQKSRIPSATNLTYSIVEVAEIAIPQFSELAEKYTQDELLPMTKSFFAEYFFQKFSREEKLVYLEATSFVFNKLAFIDQALEENNIIIVPQITQANQHPDEKKVLNTGIFHAGFFALKRSDETFKFLHWWQVRVATKGFIQLCKGRNADQLWLEHVPIFFSKVLVEKHEGLNVGHWNLSERKIRIEGDNQAKSHYFSNNSPLISYNFKDSDYWESYRQQLNNYQSKELATIEPLYGLPNPQKKVAPVSHFLAKSLRNLAQKMDILVDKIS